MDATWYVRVIRVRTEDNRWRHLVSSPDPQVRAARNPADLSSEPTAADADRRQVTETSGPADPLPGGRKQPAGAFEAADTPEPAPERPA
ncbi:hypothetical protein ABZ630_07905, partial [Streptomyces albidoflavus]